MTAFPDRYREVSVADVDVPLEIDAAARAAHLAPGLPPHALRRRRATRGATALVEVRTAPGRRLFHDVADVDAAGRARARRPTCTARTSTPASPASWSRRRRTRPDARCVVVEGRYGHVSFVLDPAPVRLHVLDVAPPWPAKLRRPGRAGAADGRGPARGTCRCRTSSTWPTCCRPQPVGHYLLQCRGGGMEVPGATVSYLDEVPPRAGLDVARLRAVPGDPRLPLRRRRCRRSTPARAPSPATSTSRPARSC